MPNKVAVECIFYVCCGGLKVYYSFILLGVSVMVNISLGCCTSVP